MNNNIWSELKLPTSVASTGKQNGNTCPQCVSVNDKDCNELSIYSDKSSKVIGHCHSCKRKGRPHLFNVDGNGSVRIVSGLINKPAGPAAEFLHECLGVGTRPWEPGDASYAQDYWMNKKAFSDAEMQPLLSHPDFGLLFPDNIRSELAEYHNPSVSNHIGRLMYYKMNPDYDGIPTAIFRDVRGKAVTAQYFDTNSSTEKAMIKGGLGKHGCMFTFTGTKYPDKYMVAEGLATALAVYHLVDGEYSVVSSISVNTVKQTIPLLADKYGISNVIYVGDDDNKGVGVDNAGRDLANELLFTCKVQSAFYDLGYKSDYYDVWKLVKEGKLDKTEVKSSLTGAFPAESIPVLYQDPIKLMSLNSARSTLRNELIKFLKPENLFAEPIGIFDFTPGTGKTHYIVKSVVEWLEANPGKRVWYLCSTHRNCIEVERDFKSALYESQVQPNILYLSQPTVNKDSYDKTYECLDDEALAMMNSPKPMESKAGHTFCKNLCGKRAICPYAQRMETEKDAEIVIMTHKKATIAVDDDVPAPDLVVIDEDAILNFRGEPIELDLSITHTGVEDASLVQALADLPDATYQSIIPISEESFDPTTPIDDAKVELLEALEQQVETSKAEADAREAEVLEQIKGMTSTRKIIKAMTTDKVRVRPWIYLAGNATPFIKCGMTNKIYIQNKPNPIRLPDSVPMIIAGAKIDEAMVAEVFPEREIVRHKVDVALADNNTITQVVDVSGKDPAQYIKDFCITNTADADKSVLISKKDSHSEYDGIFDKTDNFTSSLGSNDYVGYDCSIITYTQRAPNEAIERDAFDIFGTKVIGNEWTIQSETVGGYKVKKNLATNPYVARVFDNQVRKLAYQAAYRIRGIIPNADKNLGVDTNVNTYVLNSFNIGVQADYKRAVEVGIRKPTGSHSDDHGKLVQIAKAIEDAGENGVKKSFTALADASGLHKNTIKGIAKLDQLCEQLEQFGIYEVNKGKPSRPSYHLVATPKVK